MDRRICVYEAGTTDFASNGLGTISPTKCRVHWQENGEYSVEIEHPIDGLGKYERICVNERVVVVPVPEAPSKRLTSVTRTAAVEFYTIATRKSRLRLRSGPGTGYRCLGYYAKGKTVTLIAKTNGSWYEVTAPDGKHGWMSADYLKYSHSATARQTVSGILQELPMRPQPFDIYAVDPDVRLVTVRGRHVFWRLAENIICGPLEIRNMTAQQALDAVFAAAEDQDHGFRWYAEGDERHSLVNPIEGRCLSDVLLGEGGICETYGLKLLSDWFDIFLVKEIGENRGVQLRYAKNVKGLEGGFDLSGVVTRLIPVGRTKDGEPLYLSGTRYLLSENEGLYTRPRWGYLNVSEAKIGSEVDGEKLTASTARKLMESAAQAKLDAGCDLPDCSLQARMTQLRHDPAYQAFADLERICPGDTLGLFMPNFALALHVRLSEYDFDALSQRYEELTLGNPAINASRTGITSRQLGGASVTSGKLAPGAVGASALQSEAIAARHVQADSINAQALQAGSVTAGKIAAGALDAITVNAITAHINEIAAGSITTDALYAALAEIITLRVKQITADTLTTDELYAALADVIVLRAGQVTAENIGTDQLAAASAEITALLVERLTADNITADEIMADRLGAALADFVTLYAGVGEFDFAAIRNLVAQAMSLEQGAMDTVYIKNLAVTSANLLSATLGKLVLKGDDGRYYRVFVGSDGTISAEEVALSGGEIAAGQTGSGNQIVETGMNVGSLNASNLQASSAVINQILTTALTAEKITAADALIASATIPALYAASIQAIGNSLDLSANESIRLLVGRKNAIHYREDAPAEYNSGDVWIRISDRKTFLAVGMTGKNAPEVAVDEAFVLAYRFGGDADAYALAIDDEGWLLSTDPNARVTDGYLETTTAWVEVSPSELHTSFIDILQDYILIRSGGRIDVDAGGSVNINSGGDMNIESGGSLNVDAGAAHFRTGEYTLSILSGDGSEDTVMDFDADGRTLRVSVLEAGNMRPFIAGVTSVDSLAVGGLDGLKGLLEKNRYEHIVYTQSAGDLSGDPVEIGCCDSLQVEIIAESVTRVPPLVFRNATGSVYMEKLMWSCPGKTAFSADSGSFVLRDCYADADAGVRAARHARLAWLGTDDTMESAGACGTAFEATEGAEIRLYGLIPSGERVKSLAGSITEDDVRTGEGGESGGGETTVPLDGALGYYGTGNGWNGGVMYQGYSEGKGRIYGCMKFTLPDGAATIKAATLTMRRVSDAGRGSPADVTVYGSATEFGSRPALGSVYASRADAADPGASFSLDVTQGAQALADGAIRQLVLYTGESTAMTGKVYSKQYAKFDAATLKITY